MTTGGKASRIPQSGDSDILEAFNRIQSNALPDDVRRAAACSVLRVFASVDCDRLHCNLLRNIDIDKNYMN